MSDPAPQTDRRKTVHRDPHAETGGDRRRDGRDNEIQTDPPTTTSEAPDRRKIIHQDPQPSADGGEGGSGRGVGTITDDPPNPHDPPSLRAGGPIHGSVCCEAPAVRLKLASTLGGIEATAEERRAAAEMDDPESDDGTGRGVGTHINGEADPGDGDGEDRGVGTHITASGEDPGSTDGSGGRGVGTAPVMETACRSTGHFSTDPAW